MKRLVLSAAVVSLVVAWSFGGAIAADKAGASYGIRAGFSSDPDQFVLGAQADFGDIYHNIHFYPSIDVGFGDHLTTFGFNGDFKVFLPLPRSSVSFFGLVGPTIFYWSPDEGDGDTEIGLSLGGGVRAPLGTSGWYDLEVRAGIGDIPDVKILLGVLFGGR